MSYTLHSAHEEAQSALATALRMLQVRGSQSQSATDLRDMAAHYKRMHPIAHALRGLPEDIRPADLDTMRSIIAMLDSASPAVRATVSAYVTPTRALSDADGATLLDVLTLDAALAADPAFSVATHPLASQWEVALQSADDAHPSAVAVQRWHNRAASPIGMMAIMGVFFGLVRFSIAYFTVGWAVLTMIALITAGVTLLVVLPCLKQDMAERPARLLARAVRLGAAPECARLLAWLRAGELTPADASNIYDVLDIRETLQRSGKADRACDQEDTRTEHLSSPPYRPAAPDLLPANAPVAAMLAQAPG